MVKRRDLRSRVLNSTSRKVQLEALERRELLAAEILSVRPDAGALLDNGDTLYSPPSEFNIYFSGGSDLNEATITPSSVRLVRSGGDGSFDEGNEIVVSLGYVGLVDPGETDPQNLQHLVLRPSSSAAFNAKDPTQAFPDDHYRIEVLGTGAAPLASRDGTVFNDGEDFVRTFRLDRGAQVISVIPQPVTTKEVVGDQFTTQVDNHSLNQIEVYFDQAMKPGDVTNPAFYRLVNTQATADGTDDVLLLPESVEYQNQKAILTFANDLPEGTYRLDIGVAIPGTVSGDSLIQVGELHDGDDYSVSAYLGDQGGVIDDGDDVDVYEVDLISGTALTINIDTSNSTLVPAVSVVDPTDTSSNPTSTFTATSTGRYKVKIKSENPSATDGTATGEYRLTLSVNGNPVSITDDNSSFDTATPLGVLGATELLIEGVQIEPQGIPLPPRPGSTDEPGHREIQREAHIDATGTSPALPSAITPRRYSFPSTIGTDTSGNPYPNLITETEKQIVRDIYEVYAELSGYEFIESEDGGGTSIGKGDLRALDPSLGPDSGVAGLGGPGAVVLNGSIYDQANRFYGDGFTDVMFHEIGHSLGLGHAYELPANMGAGQPDDVLPGDHDVVHLRRIVPPNSTDIDLYQFEVEQAGELTLETIAERLPNPSLLDSVLHLYREVTDGNGDVVVRELIAQNDQAFGADSLLRLSVTAGTYYVGVTSTGNQQYDPSIEDSGFGGTTDGAYQLKLNFDAEVLNGNMRDVDDTILDGDRDGNVGGVHSFWFQSSERDNIIYVAKPENIDLDDPSTLGDGTATAPYGTIQGALNAAANRLVIPANVSVSGEEFTINDGGNSETFVIATTQTGSDAAAAIADMVNNGTSLSGVTATAVGSVVQFEGIVRLEISEDSKGLLSTPNIVRILGNAGDDNDASTVQDSRPFLIGLDESGFPLQDGAGLLVPQGVTVMINAGTLIKMQKANIDAGTSAVTLSRSHSAIQVLGTPDQSVFIRSYRDDAWGGDSDGPSVGAKAGDFGGIVFRADSDLESQGIFLNQVNHADISHGGGRVFVNSQLLVFSPVHMVNARPEVSFNLISNSADASMSATPNSFEESDGRIGPDIVGNYLVDNTIDGLFVRVRTASGSTIEKLKVAGRFDDSDITHVLTEALIINGGSGGPTESGGVLTARAAGRLTIDPGIVLKMSQSRIELERGAGALMAEGTADDPIVITSLLDDRFGGSGSYDTNLTPGSVPTPGDWSGVYFGHGTSGSIDQSQLSYGGGLSPVEGNAVPFNVIEVHQADLRLANSLVDRNAAGSGGGVRRGRGVNTPAAVYVRGSQPIIVGNDFVNNDGPAININVNSLNYESLPDTGRSIGNLEDFSRFADNQGPLVRLNRLEGNDINGMEIRGGELTTEGVWDDTDIVHVVQDEILIDNFHTYGGLTLKSSQSESLVVKLSGGNAGITVTGTPLEIIDRIGGTLHVLGSVGHPVVLTDLADDSVGAGFTPSGEVQTDTNNGGGAPVKGGWRGLLLDEFSNDRNVAVVLEAEPALTAGKEVNPTPFTAQYLGELAPTQKDGDENRRLGFDVTGFISPDDAGDLDVYSFTGVAGSQVWIDIDRTNPALHAVVEVIDANGTVIERSQGFETNDAKKLEQNTQLGGDHYSQNFRDPGMVYILPGVAGELGEYFLRVRSFSDQLDNPGALKDGQSRGVYNLQVRLDQVQEFPGSTIRYSDIRYASTAIDARGLPAHSPLIAEAGEVNDAGNTFAAAQTLINLLESDMAAIGLSGRLSSATDVDWYEFDLTQTGVQEIGGVNDNAGTIAVVIDVDYADQFVRADSTIAVYNSNQELVYVGRESNIEDDQPRSPTDVSIDDLSRGTAGKKDPFIGPIHLTPGDTYYVAVMSNQQLPTALMGVFDGGSSNPLVRLEPATSVQRVVEDHIGTSGYLTGDTANQVSPTSGLFDISNVSTVSQSVASFSLQDVTLYVATDGNGGTGDHLYTANPFQSTRWLTEPTNGGNGNDLQDVVVRTDGRMFGYQEGTANGGALVELDPSTGNVISTQNSNILGDAGSLNVSDLDPNFGNQVGALARFQEFTTSDQVSAFVFERTGTNGPSSAPVPTYDVYYAVDERDGATDSLLPNTKLYRGRENGDAAAGLVNNQPFKYGVVSDIQPSDVEFAEIEFTVRDTANPPNRSTIRIESKLPGDQGNNIRLNITRPVNANAVVTGVSGTTINLEIGLDANNAPNAGQIVAAINNHPAASKLVTAVVLNGNNGTTATSGVPVATPLTPMPIALTEGDDGNGDGPVLGRVTGLSFGQWNGTGDLFGVTDQGELLVIDPVTAKVKSKTLHVDTAGNPIAFQGLTLGPQNVEAGVYKDLLFAVSATRRVYALNPISSATLVASDGGEIQVVSSDPTIGEFQIVMIDLQDPSDSNPPAASFDGLTGVLTITYNSSNPSHTFDAIAAEISNIPQFTATVTDPANIGERYPAPNSSLTYTSDLSGEATLSHSVGDLLISRFVPIQYTVEVTDRRDPADNTDPTASFDGPTNVLTVTYNSLAGHTFEDLVNAINDDVGPEFTATVSDDVIVSEDLRADDSVLSYAGGTVKFEHVDGNLFITATNPALKRYRVELNDDTIANPVAVWDSSLAVLTVQYNSAALHTFEQLQNAIRLEAEANFSAYSTDDTGTILLNNTTPFPAGTWTSEYQGGSVNLKDTTTDNNLSISVIDPTVSDFRVDVRDRQDPANAAGPSVNFDADLRVLNLVFNSAQGHTYSDIVAQINFSGQFSASTNAPTDAFPAQPTGVDSGLDYRRIAVSLVDGASQNNQLVITALDTDNNNFRVEINDDSTLVSPRVTYLSQSNLLRIEYNSGVTQKTFGEVISKINATGKFTASAKDDNDTLNARTTTTSYRGEEVLVTNSLGEFWFTAINPAITDYRIQFVDRADGTDPTYDVLPSADYNFGTRILEIVYNSAAPTASQTVTDLIAAVQAAAGGDLFEVDTVASGDLPALTRSIVYLGNTTEFSDSNGSPSLSITGPNDSYRVEMVDDSTHSDTPVATYDSAADVLTIRYKNSPTTFFVDIYNAVNSVAGFSATTPLVSEIDLPVGGKIDFHGGNSVIRNQAGDEIHVTAIEPGLLNYRIDIEDDSSLSGNPRASYNVITNLLSVTFNSTAGHTFAQLVTAIESTPQFEAVTLDGAVEPSQELKVSYAGGTTRFDGPNASLSINPTDAFNTDYRVEVVDLQDPANDVGPTADYDGATKILTITYNSSAPTALNGFAEVRNAINDAGIGFSASTTALGLVAFPASDLSVVHHGAVVDFIDASGNEMTITATNAAIEKFRVEFTDSQDPIADDPPEAVYTAGKLQVTYNSSAPSGAPTLSDVIAAINNADIGFSAATLSGAVPFSFGEPKLEYSGTRFDLSDSTDTLEITAVDSSNTDYRVEVVDLQDPADDVGPTAVYDTATNVLKITYNSSAPTKPNHFVDMFNAVKALPEFTSASTTVAGPATDTTPQGPQFPAGGSGIDYRGVAVDFDDAVGDLTITSIDPALKNYRVEFNDLADGSNADPVSASFKPDLFGPGEGLLEVTYNSAVNHDFAAIQTAIDSVQVASQGVFITRINKPGATSFPARNTFLDHDLVSFELRDSQLGDLVITPVVRTNRDFRVQVAGNSAVGANYDSVTNLLEVDYSAGTTTYAQLVNEINQKGDFLATFSGTSSDTVPVGSGIEYVGGAIAVTATTGTFYVTANDLANDRFRVQLIDESVGSPQASFDPNTDVLTVRYDSANANTFDDLVSEISGLPGFSASTEAVAISLPADGNFLEYQGVSVNKPLDDLFITHPDPLIDNYRVELIDEKDSSKDSGPTAFWNATTKVLQVTYNSLAPNAANNYEDVVVAIESATPFNAVQWASNALAPAPTVPAWDITDGSSEFTYSGNSVDYFDDLGELQITAVDPLNDGYRVEIQDRPSLGDVGPDASYDPNAKLLRVTFNSAAPTAGNTFQDIVDAINNTGEFTATTPPVTLYPPSTVGTTTSVNSQGVFSGGADFIDVRSMDGSVRGLAFSPLDFNLWHPTTLKGNDAGHGINPAPDNTRPWGVAQGREVSELGNWSFHFGLEKWQQSNTTYFQQGSTNAQFGILTQAYHQDLSSNPAITSDFGSGAAGSYNLPGGAFGTLETGSFDLSGSVANDRPTLYFNYFLETEGHAGSNRNSDGNDPFRDSARVFISRDDGDTWDLVASNNSVLSAPDAFGIANGSAELAGFLSHLSDAGQNSNSPRPSGHQVVQELFDNSGDWRQTRVDLSDYAGETGLRLRIDFSSAGSLNDDSLLVAGDPIDGEFNPNSVADAAPFGEFVSNGGRTGRSIRSLDNQHLGFFVDDFIIGYAERGEMVTGAGSVSGITNLAAGNRTNNRDPLKLPNILDKEYQIEVRRVDEYVSQGDRFNEVSATFDTNVRHINEDPDPSEGIITGLMADRNRERPQGVFIVDSNFIRDSGIVGIHLQPGQLQGQGVTHPGAPINFPQLNTDQLIPGAVLQNNVIVGSDGIRIDGESTPSAVSFVRVINNTIVGGGRTGVGIDVNARTSPTLINNLLTDLQTGITNGGAGTVIRSNFFQNNVSNGSTGTASIIAAANAPLFLDASTGNYILESASAAVDSSQDTEQDRQNYLTFKTEIGISASPLFAPELDIFGQTRIDSDSSGTGAGDAVFKDRGATDRSDEERPYAVLLDPIDNDSLGIDRQPLLTNVTTRNSSISDIAILLGDGLTPTSPFQGSGIDPLTVDDPANPTVTIDKDGVRLVEGVDYALGFNELTGVLLLTPLSTLWEEGAVHLITLDNQRIADRAGNLLRSNQSDGTTTFTIYPGALPDAIDDTVTVNEDEVVYIDVLPNDRPIPGSPEVPLKFTGSIAIVTGPGNGTVEIPELDPANPPVGFINAGDSETRDIIRDIIKYTPDPEFNGTDTFTYTILDVEGFESREATVTVTVEPVNDVPVGVADTIRFLEDDLSAVISFSELLSNDLVGVHQVSGIELDDERNEPQTLELIDGSVELVNPSPPGFEIQVDYENEVITITTGSHWYGTAEFNYKVKDSGGSDRGGQDSATLSTSVNVEFLPVNDDPQSDTSARRDDLEPIIEDDGLQFVIDVAELESIGKAGAPNDPLEEIAQTVQVTAVTLPSGQDGEVELSDGKIYYKPPKDFFGSVSIAYTVVDLEGGAKPKSWQVDDVNGGFEQVDDQGTAERILTFDVVNVNDPPTAVPRDLFALEDRSIKFGDGSDDYFKDYFQLQSGPFNEPEGLRLVIDGMDTIPPPDKVHTEHGEITDILVGDFGLKSFVYTPNADFFGLDQINFDLVDLPEDEDGNVDLGLSNTLKFTAPVIVRPVNDDPVAQPDTIKMIEDQPRIIPISLLLANDQVNQPEIGGTSETELAANNIPQTLRIDPQSLRITNVAGGRVEIDPTGNNIVVTPPLNYYSTILENGVEKLVADELKIEYTVQDQGWSFQAVDTAVGTPLDPITGVGSQERDSKSSTGEISVQIFPVNDQPIARTHFVPDVIEDESYSIPVSDLIPDDDLFQSLNVGDSLDPKFDSAGPFEDLGPTGTKQDPLNYDGANRLMQTLRIETPFNGFDTFQTNQGGYVTFERDSTNRVVSFSYVPPTDFASVPDSRVDSFPYLLIDDGLNYSLDSNDNPTFAENPLTAYGTIELFVDARNDAPRFKVSTLELQANEDSGLNVADFAFDISAGPVNAVDEINGVPSAGVPAQSLEFKVDREGLASLEISDYLQMLDPAADAADPNSYVKVDAVSGQLSFKPADDAFGEIEFNVGLVDNGGKTEAGEQDTSLSRKITISISSVNDPPTFTAGPDVTIAEDSGVYSEPWATDISVGPDNELDEQNQTLTFEVVIDASEQQALFEVQPQISPEGILTFKPALNAVGTASIQVTAVDSFDAIEGNGRSATETLVIEITEVNDPPVGLPEFFETDEDTIRVFTEAQLLANEYFTSSDPDLNTNPNEVLTIVGASGISDQGASVTFNPITRSFTYDPTVSEILQGLLPGESKEDFFTYRVRDAAGAVSEETRVNLKVNGINDAPKQNPGESDHAWVVAGRVTQIPVLANDFDADAATGSILSILRAANNRTKISFVDGHGLVKGDVIRVSGNTAESYNVYHKIVDDDDDENVFVTDQFYSLVDRDGFGGQWENSPQPSTIRIEAPPAFGSVEIDSQGVIHYTHFGDTPFPDRFSYTVADAPDGSEVPLGQRGARSEEIFVQLEVNEVPIAKDDTFALYVNEDFELSIGDLLTNDRDPGGSLDNESFTVIDGPVSGQLVPGNDGDSYTYYPFADFLGSDSFTYQVSDHLGEVSNVATVTLIVRPSRWQNPAVRTDVNADGNTSALDALLVINQLANESLDPNVPTNNDTNDTNGGYYLDVNGDLTVTALDALNVINALSRISNPAGEQLILPGSGVIDFSVDYRVEEDLPQPSSDYVADLLFGNFEPDAIHEDILETLREDQENLLRQEEVNEEIDALDLALTLMD